MPLASGGFPVRPALPGLCIAAGEGGRHKEQGNESRVQKWIFGAILYAQMPEHLLGILTKMCLQSLCSHTLGRGREGQKLCIQGGSQVSLWHLQLPDGF